MKVGIYGQFYHANSGVYIEELLNVLDEENIEVAIEENFFKLIDENKEIEKDFHHFETFKDSG